MLQAIREKFTGWIAALIIGAISIALVISFGNMNQTPLEEDVVITVNDKEITLIDYREEYTNQLLQFQEVFGDEIPESLEFTIQESATENLIMKTLLKDYVDTQGYRVSPEFVAELITGNPNFQLGEGFNRQNYEAILTSQGISQSKYENDLRIQLQIDQLRRALIESSFITPSEFRKFVELQMEERSGQFLLIPSSNYANQVNLDNEEVSAFYSGNANSFMTEEEIDVEYLSIKIEDIAQDIEVSKSDVEQYYKENIDRFRSNEERKSSHILISFDDEVIDDAALEQIMSIEERIKAGESFESLAQEFSDDGGSAANGGDLGWAEPGLFVPEFDQVLFALEIGDISDPVKTQFGYHIIRLDDLKEGRKKEFAEIEEELTTEYSKLLAEDRLYDLAGQLDDLALQAFNELDSVADELALDLNQISAITRNGSSFLNQEPELIDILFSPSSVEQFENTPVYEFNNSIIVARVIGHRLPEIKSLSDVEGEIKSLLIAQKSIEIANEEAKKMVTDLSSGKTISELLDLNTLELKEFDDIRRNDDVLPRGLMDALFSTLKENIDNNHFTAVTVGEDVYLFEVLRINPGKLDDFNDQERDSGKIALAEELGSNELASFAKQLRENAVVEINPNLFSDAYDL
jgi:peptidyl-prolyl cis-trans isomerase D